MTLDHFLNQKTSSEVIRFIFSEKNKPFAQLADGGVHYFSEVALDRDEVEALLKEFSVQQGVVLHGGEKYQLNVLNLKDAIRLELTPVKLSSQSLQDMCAPGFLTDWARAKEGVVFFYGNDESALKDVRLAFARERAESVKGSSLIFVDGGVDFTGAENHEVFSSVDENGFWGLDRVSSCNTYSFKSDFSKYDVEKAARIIDQEALVSLQASWRDLSMCWSEINNWAGQRFKDFIFNRTIGFVGVRKIKAKEKETMYFFEALPYDIKPQPKAVSLEVLTENLYEKIKEQGVTFNQSLLSLTLKRKIELEEAYKASSYPEELNRMFEKAGI